MPTPKTSAWLWPRRRVSWLPPMYKLQVTDIFGAFKTLVFQLFYQVDGVVDAVDNAVFVAVGSFIFGAGLQPYFKALALSAFAR